MLNMIVRSNSFKQGSPSNIKYCIRKDIIALLFRFYVKDYKQSIRSMKKKEEAPNKNQFTLQTAQQQAFLEVFNLHAKNGKINKKDLHDIFDRIGFKISQNNFNDVCSKAFGNNQFITFQEFMETFKVKESNYDLIDIKNAFRLIAGESDEFISIDEMKGLFGKQGYDEERVNEMMELLSVYIEEGQFNFKKFLSHLS